MRRTYVTLATENYHYLALFLTKSLKRYSSYDINVFCLNYSPNESGLEIPNGVNFHKIDYEINEEGLGFEELPDGNFYVHRRNPRIFQITSRKPESCIRVLEMGYDEVCFIDCDSIACPNIDEIFDHSNNIKNLPLLTKGPHEFVMVPDDEDNIRGNPFEGCWPFQDITKTLEWPLMQFLQVDISQRGEYRTGNLFIANKSCLPFLKTFEEFLNVLWKLVDVYYYCPFQEETLLNVLIWKHGGDGLPMSYINLNEGAESVKKFYEINVEEDTFLSDFLKIPKDKNQIKVLHGEKREQELEKIIQHLDFLKEKGYFDLKL
jgi:hypothetical protein